MFLPGCQPFQGQIFGWEPARPPPAAAGGGGVAGSDRPGGAGAGGDPTPLTGGAGSPADAGEVEVAPPDVDNTIKFDWAATVPGGGGGCAGGLYQGAFSCAPEEGLNVVPLEGSIAVELVGPTESQTLDVSRGNLQSVPVGGTGFETMVTGKVACDSDVFMGKIEEIPVTTDQLGPVVQILWNVGTPQTTLSGYLVGRLTPQSLEGEIQLIMVTNTCTGKFSLRVQP